MSIDLSGLSQNAQKEAPKDASFNPTPEVLQQAADKAQQYFRHQADMVVDCWEFGAFVPAPMGSGEKKEGSNPRLAFWQALQGLKSLPDFRKKNLDGTETSGPGERLCSEAYRIHHELTLTQAASHFNVKSAYDDATERLNKRIEAGKLASQKAAKAALAEKMKLAAKKEAEMEALKAEEAKAASEAEKLLAAAEEAKADAAKKALDAAEAAKAAEAATGKDKQTLLEAAKALEQEAADHKAEAEDLLQQAQEGTKTATLAVNEAEALINSAKTDKQKLLGEKQKAIRKEFDDAGRKAKKERDRRLSELRTAMVLTWSFQAGGTQSFVFTADDGVQQEVYPKVAAISAAEIRTTVEQVLADLTVRQKEDTTENYQPQGVATK